MAVRERRAMTAMVEMEMGLPHSLSDAIGTGLDTPS
jgi:hypothetical protein